MRVASDRRVASGFRALLIAAVFVGGAGSVHAGPYYPPPYPPSRMEVDFFYDSLAPYGLWVEFEPYGLCWAPDVPYGWRPYAEGGNWVLTDYGWTWVSDYPWGWAPFHYGRWAWSDYYGWVWIPGYEWAPAWVAWRYGGDYVGWAPLPPQAAWHVGIGFSMGDWHIDAWVAQDTWCFVRDRDFVRPHVRRYFVRDHDRHHYFGVTRDVTRYVVRGDRIINEGVDVRHIERRTGRPVRVYRAVDHPRARESGRIRGREVYVFRPEFRRDASDGPDRIEARREDRRERSEDRPVRRPPEVLERQARENREVIMRQRAERARMEEQYRARIEGMPQRDRPGVENRMRSDMRRLEDRQHNERQQMQERIARDGREAREREVARERESSRERETRERQRERGERRDRGDDRDGGRDKENGRGNGKDHRGNGKGN